MSTLCSTTACLKRCTFCYGPLKEVLEAREVSFYLNAEFHNIKDMALKQPIIIQVQEPLLRELALGQTYEMVLKGHHGLNQNLECLSLTPLDDHLRDNS